jgi:hypothetical protein
MEITLLFDGEKFTHTLDKKELTPPELETTIFEVFDTLMKEKNGEHSMINTVRTFCDPPKDIYRVEITTRRRVGSRA